MHLSSSDVQQIDACSAMWMQGLVAFVHIATCHIIICASWSMTATESRALGLRFDADFEGYSMSNAPPAKVSIQTLQILQSHYPERLGLALCYHPPWVFQITWRVGLCKILMISQQILVIMQQIVLMISQLSLLVLISIWAFLKENPLLVLNQEDSQPSLFCRSRSIMASHTNIGLNIILQGFIRIIAYSQHVECFFSNAIDQTMSGIWIMANGNMWWKSNGLYLLYTQATMHQD